MNSREQIIIELKESLEVQQEVEEAMKDPGFVQFLNFMRLYEKMPRAKSEAEVKQILDRFLIEAPALAATEVVKSLTAARSK